MVITSVEICPGRVWFGLACSKCKGKITDSTYKFCPHCGKAITNFRPMGLTTELVDIVNSYYDQKDKKLTRFKKP